MIILRLNFLGNPGGEKLEHRKSTQQVLAVGTVCTYQWSFLDNLPSILSTSHLWSFRSPVDLALFPRLVTRDQSHSFSVNTCFADTPEMGYEFWQFVSLDSASGWKSCGPWCSSRKKGRGSYRVHLLPDCRGRSSRFSWRGQRKLFYILTHGFTFQSYLQPFNIASAVVKNWMLFILFI